VVIVDIIVAALIVLGSGVAVYFAYLTEGSESNAYDALVPVRESCLEDCKLSKGDVVPEEKLRKSTRKATVGRAWL